MSGYWEKTEDPSGEIASVRYPTRQGDPIVINLTAHGAIMARRREEERQRQLRKIALNPDGIDARWLLFGPFVKGKPIFS
jgi:predicted lipoprotein